MHDGEAIRTGDLGGGGGSGDLRGWRRQGRKKCILGQQVLATGGGDDMWRVTGNRCR